MKTCPNPQELNARFFPEVEEALRKARWFPGRQVEEAMLQKWYVLKWEDAPGYGRLFPAAYRFLHEFGGLKLGSGSGAYLIDPLETIGSWEDKRIYYEWLLETSLYPVGQADTGDVLHIDVQGRFWNILGDALLKGSDTEEALSNILVPELLWSKPLVRMNINVLDASTIERINRIFEAEQNIAASTQLLARSSEK